MYQWPKRSYSILDPYLDLNSDSKSDNINPSTGKSDKVKLYYKEVCIYVWEIISRAFFSIYMLQVSLEQKEYIIIYKAI